VRVSTNRGLRRAGRRIRPALAHADLRGHDGEPLVLTANPTGLETDRVYEATVTVSSSDPVVDPATIRVGLWVGSMSPEPLTTVAVSHGAVVTDPVRPYAYLSTSSSSIAVYNVHTAAQVGTITLPDTSVYAMAVSSDGARLFGVDEPHHTVVPVDLATWSPAAAWSLPAGARYTRIAFARPNGVAILVTTSGSVHDPVTGASWGTFSVPTSEAAMLIAASRNGSRVCTAEEMNNPYTLKCLALDATTLPGSASPVVLGPVRTRYGAKSSGTATYAHDVALSVDGTRAYVAAGATSSPYEFTIYDATASTLPVLGGLPSTLYPGSVHVGWDDRVYCGATNAYSATSAWVYDAAGVQDWSYQLGTVSRRQLVASGDALRIVALTGDGNTSTAVKFVTVAP
jgi:hypothetical protein